MVESLLTWLGILKRETLQDHGVVLSKDPFYATYVPADFEDVDSSQNGLGGVHQDIATGQVHLPEVEN